MKKIISIEKDITFPTTIGEITSIALDNDLKFINSSNIEGNLILSGTYKMTEATTIEDKFKEDIPTTIILDEIFDIQSSEISIDNFNYEVINEDTLKCSIDILINGLEEVVIEEKEELVRECDGDVKEEILIVDEEKEEDIETEDNGKNLSSLFESLSDNDDTFTTYSIYIYRKEDTLEQIMEKYKVTKEDLSEYNDLSKIEIGSKIIIPSTNE